MGMTKQLEDLFAFGGRNNPKFIEKQRLAFFRNAAGDIIDRLADRALELLVCRGDLFKLGEGVLLEL